jgi:predicted secreted protein
MSGGRRDVGETIQGYAKGGVMKGPFLFLALFIVAVSPVFGGQQNPAPSSNAAFATAGDVWVPGPSFMDKVHGKCDSLSYPRLGSCFAEVMRESGASPGAVAFAGRMGNEAWLRAFRDTGRVAIAYITRPFRANENQGVLLVNGTPPMVDVDDVAREVQEDLKRDSVYAALAGRFPGISLWPGDRYGTEFPVARAMPGGGQRFLVGYLLRNGCHACEEIGSAVVAFDFDNAGAFTGTKVMMVTDTSGKSVSDPAVPLSVEAGREFSLTLPSNPTTGYGWVLAGPEEGVVKLVGSSYRPSTPGLIGSGGMENWTFKAVGKGTTVLSFSYARPWEKGTEPIRQAAFVVIVK